MTKRRLVRSGVLEGLGPIVLAALCLLVVMLVMASGYDSQERAWFTLNQLLGSSLVLLGAIEVIRARLDSTGLADLRIIAPIVMVLAGGVFLQGGAALIGLGILGAVVVVMQGRVPAEVDDSGESE